MEHTLLTRVSAFTFAGALTLSLAACDDEAIQPSEEDQMTDQDEEEDDAAEN
ncbi:hypothetical protein GCM10023354_20840 [Garicola koreensis]|uniref:hypothetical protein n=1 Tax=Garicola koreensis TaxID=1262554 RepID=UPI0031EE20FC